MNDTKLRDLLRDKATKLAQVHDTVPQAAKLTEAIAALDEADRREIAARPDPATCVHDIDLPIGAIEGVCRLCKRRGHVGNWISILQRQRDDALKEVAHWKKEAGCG